jgi:hypothetical protein
MATPTRPPRTRTPPWSTESARRARARPGFRGRSSASRAADFGTDTHYLIGDATAAYKEEAGLLEFLRHVLYIKPSTWVIVDEFEADAPSTFELYFHADFPFEDLGQNLYKVEGASGSLSMQLLKPADVAHQAFVQQLTGTDGNPEGDIQALRVYNPSQVQRTLFLMVLEAYPTGSQPQVDAFIQDTGGGEELVLQTPSGEMRWRLDPDRSDRTDPVLVAPGGPDEDGGGAEDGGQDAGSDDGGAGEAGDQGGQDDAPVDAGADGAMTNEDPGTVGGSCGCETGRGCLYALPLFVLFWRRIRISY